MPAFSHKVNLKLAAQLDGTSLSAPGVSASRVARLPAGTVAADAILDLLGVGQLEQCPWALREGVILRRLDTLAQGLGTLPDPRFTSGGVAGLSCPRRA
ncbi:MAG TPA: hypothetical protein VFQ68_14290 [Streptosporangiaceae bacterium]|nr:hypothetical protein [Streptosporangiaceae bacterium]